MNTYENYMTCEDIAKSTNLSKEYVRKKINKLMIEKNIDAKKVLFPEKKFAKWIVLKSDVIKYFRQKKNTSKTKRKIIAEVYEQLKKENTKVRPRDVKNELKKLSVSATDPYIHTIISTLGYESRNQPNFIKNKNSQPKQSINNDIKNAVDFIKSLPEDYDPIKILELSEKLIKEFGDIQKAKDSVELVYNIKNSL